jgi:hypothetical protein
MELIKEIYKNWKPLTEEQPLFKGCDMFTGKESFDEIANLLLSVQGIEFCTKNNFPELSYFKRFDKEKAAAKGIYISAGTVTIENQETVLLTGNTHGILKYNNTKKGYKVILMHGATARIIADDFAVVFVFGQKDNAIIKTTNNAIVK